MNVKLPSNLQLLGYILEVLWSRGVCHGENYVLTTEHLEQVGLEERRWK